MNPPGAHGARERLDASGGAMKVYEFWCTKCPTRLRIEHDKGAVEFWCGRAYTSCPVCDGSLVTPDVLTTRGIMRYDGSTYKIAAETPAEHAKLNAVWPADDLQRERDRWEREGKEKGFR